MGVTRALSSLQSPLGFDQTTHREFTNALQNRNISLCNNQLQIENEMELNYRLKKIIKNLSFVLKCLSGDLSGELEDKSPICDSSKAEFNCPVFLQSPHGWWDDDNDDDNCCWLPVITAPPAHMSLLSQQMMGHLCLTAATGIAGPSLTCLLITPSGHSKRGAWISDVQ